MHPLAVSPFMTGPGTLLPFASDESEGSSCQKPTLSDRLAGRMTEGADQSDVRPFPQARQQRPLPRRAA